MQLRDLYEFGLDEAGDGPDSGSRVRKTRLFRHRRSKYWWDFFQEPDGRWRWQKLDSDGNLVALSPASYRSVADCVNSAEADGFIRRNHSAH